MGGRQRTSLFMEKGREEEQTQATKAKKGYKKRK